MAVDHRRTIRRANVENLKTDILRNTTQKKCGPHERLGFASEGTTFRVRVARRNRIPRKNCVRDNIPGGNARGYMPGRDNGGNRNRIRGIGIEPHRKIPRTYRKTTGLMIKKRIAGSPVGLRQGKSWKKWRGQPPPKPKKGNGPYGRNR